MDPANVVGEPLGRNTAACIGLGALLARRRGRDDAMLVLPADHLVEPVDAFRELARTGARWVEAQPALVTFGIRPTHPETGYGYIRVGESLPGAPEGIRRAASFLEKPSPERAAELVAAGDCLWNSGMFLWRPSVILDEIRAWLPELAEVLDRIDAALGTRPLPEVLDEMYADAPAISIDYGVMEKAREVAVIEAGFAWSDVGSWEAMREIHAPDDDRNVVVGDAVCVDATGCTVHAPGRPVALLGVDDLVVVDAGDAVLVCRRDRAQEVRRVVAALREQGREDLL